MRSDDIASYLRQAGCSEELCGRMAALAADGNAHEGLPELARARLELLGQVRDTEGRLSCLDQAIHIITMW